MNDKSHLNQFTSTEPSVIYLVQNKTSTPVTTHLTNLNNIRYQENVNSYYNEPMLSKALANINSEIDLMHYLILYPDLLSEPKRSMNLFEKNIEFTHTCCITQSTCDIIIILAPYSICLEINLENVSCVQSAHKSGEYIITGYINPEHNTRNLQEISKHILWHQAKERNLYLNRVTEQ